MKVLLACLVFCLVLAYIHSAPQCESGERGNRGFRRNRGNRGNSTTLEPATLNPEAETIGALRRGNGRSVANSNTREGRREQAEQNNPSSNARERRREEAGQANSSGTRRNRRNQQRRSTPASEY